MKNKKGYYLEFLTPETMELLGSIKIRLKWLKCSLFRNYRNRNYIINCNVVNNSYQENSRVLYMFVPNKSFSQLLYISHKNHIFLKTFDSGFS